jgi:DNA-directed RNA polymerase subunit M/transcription elongation factor TFIIS
MAITISCPECDAQLRVRADFVGKSIKCPQCSKVVRVEEPLEEAPLLDDDPPQLKPARPRRAAPRDEDEDDDRPRRRKRVDDEGDDDDEGEGEGDEGQEKRPKKKRGKYVPCPSCGGRDASRVIWTFWGSFYGPAMFTHVRCPDCGTKYNGRNGRSNLIPAVIFVMIPLMFIGLIFVALGWFVVMPMLKRKGELHLPVPAHGVAAVGAMAGGRQSL